LNYLSITLGEPGYCNTTVGSLNVIVRNLLKAFLLHESHYLHCNPGKAWVYHFMKSYRDC
jgi:hypothetical protein